MSHRWFGANQAPIYDIAHSDVVYSFGANFLETWMSPVAQSHNYGDMRQGQLGGRGMLIHFEPRLSSTAASADEWYPISPGTEGMVALGIGRIIVEENLGRTGAQRENAHLFRNVDINLISDISGVEIEKLQRLARIFAEANRPVAIPGGNLAGHSNVDDAMDAVMALNLILRRFGREGGVFLPMQVPAAPYAQEIPSTSFSQVLDLVDRMKGGRVQTLFIHGTNPVYDLPPWVGFVEALEHVPLVVSFSSFIDETAAQADYILPDHTYLEGWGYHVPSPGTDRPFVSSQQPIIQPLYDTRSTGDVFIHLAHQIGGEASEALPWTDEVDFLQQSSANLFGSSISAYDSNSPEGFWSRWRQYGGWWSQKPIWTEPELKASFSEAISVQSAIFNGDEENFPFILMPYETVTLGDGRGANQPWLQETPDPMTTARWNTWIEINPETAKNLELENNDIVRVISTQGVLEAPVVIFPGIRPDVVAIPIGQGHQDYGRFAAGRGSNVMNLIAQIESIPEEINWASTRVRLERVGRVKNLARLESLDGEGQETIR
jgi:anaerobic selenocysteine-containing dehydrogenase